MELDSVFRATMKNFFESSVTSALRGGLVGDRRHGRPQFTIFMYIHMVHAKHLI